MKTLLRQSEWCSLFLIFAAVLLTTFAYSLLLPADIMGNLLQSRIAQFLGVSFWRSYFECAHSNTVLKEALLAFFLLPLGLLLLVCQWCNGQSARRKTAAELVCSVEFWLLLFWIYCALRCLPAGGFLPSWLTNPTPNIGLMTLVNITCGLLVLVTLQTVTDWRRVTKRFMDFVCVLGAILALISVVQHFGWSDTVLIKPSDPRNRIGSLIGHNVGLSAWLVFPLSFAFLFVLRRDSSKLRKALSLALILLICWVIVAAQSRSMWGLLAVLLPIYLWIQTGKIGIARALRIRALLLVVLTVLLVIVSQTVSPRYNPLAENHQVSLKERLQAFRLDTLKTETRLRILVCSGSLLRERPLLGHGLGSFQYVYQPAQGNWLARHRDSAIAGTWKRTDVAHNDPLQLLIELGALGALLMLFSLGLFAYRGRRFYCKAPADEQSMRLALLFPVGMMVCHAFLDFPFHVVPLALLWVVSFGLLCGGVRMDVEEGESVAGSNAWAYRIVIGICMVIYFVLMAKAYSLETHAVSADRYEILGSRQLSYAQSIDSKQFEQKGQMLQNAKALFRKAIHTNVFNGRAYEGAARTDMEMGGILEELLEEENSNTTEVQVLRDAAVHNYENAKTKIKQMMNYGELNYHYSHYLEGIANWGLWRLMKTDDYLDATRQSFTDAITMNPADTHSQYELAQVYDLNPEKNKAKLAQVKRDLFHKDSYYATELFLMPELEKTLNGEGTKAIAQVNRLGMTIPDEWRIRVFEAELYLLMSQWTDANTTEGLRTSVRAKERLRLAEGMIRQVVQNQQKSDESIELAILHLLMASGKYADAVEHAKVNMRVYPGNLEFAVACYELSLQLGRKVELPDLVRKNQNDADNLVLYYKTFYLDKLPEVSSILYVRAQDKQALIDTRPFVRVADFVIHHGRPDMAQTLYDWMKEHPDFAPRRRECLKDLISASGTKE